MAKYLLLLFFCILPLMLIGQSVQSIVVDGKTNETIPGVFVFLENTSIGTSTDIDGHFSLDVSKAPDLKLVLSHMNYELKSLDQKSIPDTIKLNSQSVNIQEFVVRSRLNKSIRRRRLSTFKSALLGSKVKRKLVQLLNPEVLLFEKVDGVLSAKAIAPLEIKNKYLGYLITFYLKEFTLNAKNQLVFSGNVFYQELDGTVDEKRQLEKNREYTYNNSSRKFFKELYHNDVSSKEYVLGYSSVSFPEGITRFHETKLKKVELNRLPNEELEIPIESNFTVIINKYTPDKFYETATYFNSSSNNIIVNKFGRIVNSREVRNNGYWSEDRLDTLLPLNFSLD